MIDRSVCFVCLSTQVDIQLNIQNQCSPYPDLLYADNIQYIFFNINIYYTAYSITME